MGKIKILQAGNKWSTSKKCYHKGFTPHKYHCAGFTLLELILVILIAGISVSIVVVSIGKAHEKMVFRDISKKVFITLKHAREVAIMERTPVIFKIDEKNNSFWMEKDGAVFGKSYNMPSHISISGESIIFFPKGNSSGGYIKIKNEKEKEFFIEVDPVLGTSKVKGV